MAEVRRIAAAEKPPRDSDHVLIQRTPGGRYSVSGSVQSGTKEATFWTPPAFATLGGALFQAGAWADANGVPVIYVVEGR